MRKLTLALIGFGLVLASIGCGSKETIATDGNGKRIMNADEKAAIQAEREKYGF